LFFYIVNLKTIKNNKITPTIIARITYGEDKKELDWLLSVGVGVVEGFEAVDESFPDVESVVGLVSVVVPVEDVLSVGFVSVGFVSVVPVELVPEVELLSVGFVSVLPVELVPDVELPSVGFVSVVLDELVPEVELLSVLVAEEESVFVDELVDPYESVLVELSLPDVLVDVDEFVESEGVVDVSVVELVDEDVELSELELVEVLDVESSVLVSVPVPDAVLLSLLVGAEVVSVDSDP